MSASKNDTTFLICLPDETARWMESSRQKETETAAAREYNQGCNVSWVPRDVQHNANGSSIFRVLLTCELGFSEMDGSRDGAIDVEGSRLGCPDSDGADDWLGEALGMIELTSLYPMMLSFMLKDVPPGLSNMYTPDSMEPTPKGFASLIP